MKKILLAALVFIIPFTVFSQEDGDEADGPKDGWAKKGNISLLFSQAAFNEEWTGGGTSNIAGNLTFSYDANLKRGKLSWDNRVMADYGISKTRDQETERKTNDRLDLNSIVGRQIKESRWSYSYFLNFKTQFTAGYEFSEDNNGNEVKSEVSDFMSPGYLQTGPGMLWKKSDDLKVNIAPATARFIFVDGEFTDVMALGISADDFNAAGGFFGVKANETSRFEFGASLSGYAKFPVVTNVTMENILNLYTNYLDDPQNVDIDYTLNVLMAINEYLTANVAFQAIYDDNAVQGFQIREALAIGLSLGF